MCEVYKLCACVEGGKEWVGMREGVEEGVEGEVGPVREMQWRPGGWVYILW